jgi:hypothetical protein
LKTRRKVETRAGLEVGMGSLALRFGSTFGYPTHSRCSNEWETTLSIFAWDWMAQSASTLQAAVIYWKSAISLRSFRGRKPPLAFMAAF